MPGSNKTRKSSQLLSVIGWILGALSVMNLIKEFTPLKLAGLVLDWVTAYASFVSKVREVLFGWLDWHWMLISDITAVRLKRE